MDYENIQNLIMDVVLDHYEENINLEHALNEIKLIIENQGKPFVCGKFYE